MKTVFSSRRCRDTLWVVVLSVITFCTTGLPGCRDADPGCTSNQMCPEGAVCSSTGMCEQREERVANRLSVLMRFGGDARAYGLWLRYGTAGASTFDDAPSGLLAQTPSLENTASQNKNEDAKAQSTSVTAKDPHVLCSLNDVRTDDLIFTYTTDYPGGYWGPSPIADQQSGRCGDDLETLTWRLLNCERISRELTPVKCDLRLVWIGRQHADDMAIRGFFSHINPDGQNPFERLLSRGIPYEFAGENIARQQSVFDAHIAWMDSEDHRRNILTPQYQYAGIGVVPYRHQLLLSEAFVGEKGGKNVIVQGAPDDEDTQEENVAAGAQPSPPVPSLLKTGDVDGRARAPQHGRRDAAHCVLPPTMRAWAGTVFCKPRTTGLR